MFLTEQILKSTPSRAQSAAAIIRSRIETNGEKYWHMNDFADLPPAAVMQTLSRLAREHILERVGKGLYYHSRPTMFGPSQPAESDILMHRLQLPMFPAGLTAANLLGFTTQNPARPEYATPAHGIAPQTLGTSRIKVYTRRPESWNQLSSEDAALLDFLRTRGRNSELSPRETINHLLTLLRQGDHFERLLTAANREPPRVRAMIGALGQELGVDLALLPPLKESLNPFSRFDFGLLSSLTYAKEWQAK